MRRRRANAGIFQRLLEGGRRSTSHREELQRRRGEGKKRARLDAMRKREADREELRREREQIREANRLKRRMLKEEQSERKAEAKRKAEERAERSIPSAAAIQRAYDRGAKSLSEAMEMARGNPPDDYTHYRQAHLGSKDKAVRLAKKKLAAGNRWAEVGKKERRGRQKGKYKVEYGSSPYMAEGLKVNPRGHKGDFSRCVKAVSQRKGAKDPEAICAAQERKRGVLNPDDTPNRRAFVGPQRKDGKFPVQLVYPGSGARAQKLMTQEQVDELRNKGYDVFGSSRRNPADAAMAVSEEFHGRKVKAMIPVSQKRHYHKYLAELGELRKLEVLARDGKHRVTLSKFDGAMLCTNEDKNQLFLVGGDQGVDLRDFGIKDAHETETLGEVTKIEYFTDKEHLGSEGGEAVYVHKFRTTNGGRGHKTVRLARNPDLIYYLRDEHLEFSGGSYFIRAEGIDL